VFCRADKVPRLFLRSDSTDFAWYAQAMNGVEGVLAFGVTVPRSSVALKKVDGVPALEFPVPGFRAERLAGMREISVEAEGSRSIREGFFLFDLPKTNAVSTMSIALKNCI
jgi:hypothetical protein